MSIFYKDNFGKVNRIASHLIQRVNARWFLCQRVMEDGQEYYDVPELETLNYFNDISPFTIYSFGFSEPNTTQTPKLRYKGVAYNILDVTSLESDHIGVGQLKGVYQMFTQESSTDKSIYFIGNMHTDHSDFSTVISKIIVLGMNGVIEANRVVFEVQNADSYVEFRTNQREFLINGHLPLVGELDDTLPINITFGDTTYNVYSYMKGSATPITIGDLKSNMTYNETTGYSFTSKMIFLETSDYVGFVISPATITAEQLANIIKDTETVVVSLDNSGTKLDIQLSSDVINKLAKTLVTPMSSPTATELVGVNDQNMQTMIELGNGIILDNGVLSISLNDDLAPYVSYAVSQSLTEEQKAVARSNIGAGSSAFSGLYPELEQKPILNTSNTTSQTEQVDEIINGTINLHKVSKTGALADMIQDSTNRTVTDTEKENWNNPQYSSIQNVPNASTGVAGVIQIATDQEAETGTNTTKAVNPKQLKTAFQGLGSVFTLKGSKQSVSELPASGNSIGDVWYVIDESVGYIWLNDGTTDKWEQLGLPIDLSTYMQFSDVINNLTSTESDKPLSALQGKTLNKTISNVINNTNKISNSTGGFSAGLNSSASLGGAIGNNAKSYFGGAIGSDANSDYGGAVGSDTIAGNGFAGGFNAKTMTDTSDNTTVIDAIQLGTGTNQTEKSLQVYNDNIYNADTHTLTVQKIDTSNTSIANSNGGFSAGTNSSAVTGGALGSGAKETYGGGAVGINTTASRGFAGGRGTTAVDGGAVGWSATADTGGAVGSGATVTGGGGVGNGATTGNGFAGGYLAKTVDSSGNKIDAIQLGQGTNATAKTLQIYGDNIYNANTHTLDAQIIKKNGVNVPDINGYVAGLKEDDTRSTNSPPSYYYGLHSLGKDFIVEFKSTDTVGLTDDMLIPSYSPYCQLETHILWGDKSGGPVVQLAYTYGQIFQRYGEDTWSEWSAIPGTYLNNHFGSNMPTHDVLFSGNANSGNITISSPLTNYDYIMVLSNNDTTGRAYSWRTIPVWQINHAVNNGYTTIVITCGYDIWTINVSSLTSTTLTTFSESARLREIWGVKFK